MLDICIGLIPILILFFWFRTMQDQRIDRKYLTCPECTKRVPDAMGFEQCPRCKTSYF